MVAVMEQEVEPEVLVAVVLVELHTLVLVLQEQLIWVVEVVVLPVLMAVEGYTQVAQAVQVS